MIDKALRWTTRQSTQSLRCDIEHTKNQQNRESDESFLTNENKKNTLLFAHKKEERMSQ